MSQTTSASFASASFVNLLGILVSVVLCILFIVLGGHTLKYIKQFACKIKIIVNRAEDKAIKLKDYNYKARHALQNNESFNKLEVCFKNEIRKSRSLQFGNILKSYMHKYDHVLYYAFRDRTTDKYDLLKPKTTFYTLLVVTSCCISWMITIFLSAILQSMYSNVQTIPLSMFIGVTVGVAVLSSVFNLVCINRLFRIYVLNVKGAFKVDYGHQYVHIDQGLQEYEPDNTIEGEEFMKGKK